MKKKLLIAGGVLVGLIVLALLVVYLTLNSAVKIAVEKGATQSLKVRTQLARASVAPFSGDVSLTDLRVANPEGFTAPEIFALNSVSVKVSYRELFGQPVKVAAISVQDPRLVIEQAGGKFNFMELADNLKSDKPAPTPEPTPPGETTRVIINSIEMSGASVTVLPGIPGLEKPITITVPPISLQNIGNADGNQTGEEIGRVVTDLVEAIAQKAAESDQLPPEVRQILKFDVEKMKAELTNRVNQEVDKLKDKATKEIEKGLGDLLGGNKKKDEKK
jgi:uncharacterized protein involved in outer membrane biogenesis